MKTLKTLFAVAVVALLFSQCTYDFIAPVEEPDPTVEVSFAAEIAPIFSDNNCTACHGTGARAPELTAANAYSSIVPAYVNLDTPEESEIYTQPNPANTGSHPKYSEAQAALVLTWIQQGAKNN